MAGASELCAPEPRNLAGIRNFAWILEGKLGRGEQPPLETTTFAALEHAGFSSIMSLRQDGEPARDVTGRLVPPYSVEEERAYCERFGLHFLHLGCTDFQALCPDDVAAALRAIDGEIAAGRAVFVHCLAGVGRSSAVAAAWFIARGGLGNEAARMHARFIDELEARLGLSPGEQEAYVKKVRRAGTWWGFLEIARALGEPVTEWPSMLAPERPLDAIGWERWYQRALLPWRRKQPGL